jgi:hypothetical protein
MGKKAAEILLKIIRVMTRMHNINGCKSLYDNEKQVC